MTYLRSRLRSALGAISSVVVASCSSTSDPAPVPTTGALVLTLTVSGTPVDTGALVVRIDGGAERRLLVGTTLRVDSLSPGAHLVAVNGVPFNCDDQDAGRLPALVTAGGITPVPVTVACGPVLRRAIVFTSEAFGLSELMATRTDRPQTYRITRDQAVYVHPAVSPDGREIVYASRLGGGWNGIYISDADGRNRRRLVSRSSFDGEPAWSPDGQRILFRSVLGSPGTPSRIYVVNRDGTGVRQVSPPPPPDSTWLFDNDAAWSPDGQWIIFIRIGDVYTVRPDGSGMTLVRRCKYSCAQPRWSPDGRRIAFAEVTDADGDGVAEGHADIWVMQGDGTGARRLTTSAWQDNWPSWSPDGTEIVFQRAEKLPFNLYRIRADGSGEARLEHIRDGGSPSWSPVQ